MPEAAPVIIATGGVEEAIALGLRGCWIGSGDSQKDIGSQRGS